MESDSNRKLNYGSSSLVVRFASAAFLGSKELFDILRYPANFWAVAKNVLGGELMTCSENPMTGYFRNGKCDTCGNDSGMHMICAQMTEKFLEFSKERENDLITPVPAYNFPGLRPGDFWCLCLQRWIEAHEAGVAPRVKLSATHTSVLEFVDIDILKSYAVG